MLFLVIFVLSLFGGLVVASANPASDSIELTIAIVRHGIGSDGAVGDASAVGALCPREKRRRLRLAEQMGILPDMTGGFWPVRWR